jgi:hypothetical protein
LTKPPPGWACTFRPLTTCETRETLAEGLSPGLGLFLRELLRLAFPVPTLSLSLAAVGDFLVTVGPLRLRELLAVLILRHATV